MKRLLILSTLVVTVSLTTAAQGILVGLRTGSSCWMQRAAGGGKIEPFNGQRHSWDNELFVRWQRKSRWAFEGSVSYTSLRDANETGITTPGCFGPLIQVPYVRTYRRTFYDVSVGAQYDITCKAMKHCPLMKRMRNYVGVSIIPSYVSSVGTYRDESSTTVWRYNSNYIQLWAGLSHTLVYDLNSRIAISSVVEGKAAPRTLLDDMVYPNDPVFRTSVRLGVACKL